MGIRIASHDLAFSSAWLGPKAGCAESVVEAAAALGLAQVKVGPAQDVTPAETFSQHLKKYKVKVVATQNLLCLGSRGSLKETETGLGDPQPGDREEAMARILETVRATRALGAGKLIIRLGSMKIDALAEIDKDCRSTFEADGLSEEVVNLIDKGRTLYLEHEEAYLDRLLRTLYSLLKADRNLKFCIETSCELHGLPNLQGLRYIFEDLKSPRLAYWHNTGHGHLQESLGLVPKGAWLGEFGAQCAGINLHDALGLEGGLPPGIGEVDFRALKENLPSEATAVLDMPPNCSIEAFRMGLDELRRKGF